MYTRDKYYPTEDIYVHAGADVDRSWDHVSSAEF